MTQTFIDMLVAIKDPAAIEKAYNILAAKRELLAAERNTVKTREFAHTFMEPKPIGKTGSEYNDFGAGDLVEFASINVANLKHVTTF